MGVVASALELHFAAAEVGSDHRPSVRSAWRPALPSQRRAMQNRVVRCRPVDTAATGLGGPRITGTTIRARTAAAATSAAISPREINAVVVRKGNVAMTVSRGGGVESFPMCGWSMSVATLPSCGVAATCGWCGVEVSDHRRPVSTKTVSIQTADNSAIAACSRDIGRASVDLTMPRLYQRSLRLQTA